MVKIMKRNSGRVVKSDFFTCESMPEKLKEIAHQSGLEFKPEDGIIAVKTKIASPLAYDFDIVGKGKGVFVDYVNKVAKGDGINMETVVENALIDKDF